MAKQTMTLKQKIEALDLKKKKLEAQEQLRKLREDIKKMK